MLYANPRHHDSTRGKNGGAKVKTDDNGRYISNLAAGTYRVTLVISGVPKAFINNTTLQPAESAQLNFDLTQPRAFVTVKKPLHRVWIPAFTGSRLPGLWVEVDDGRGLGPRKLLPTTLYGLADKNYSEPLTAWILKETNNRAGSLTARVISPSLQTGYPRHYGDTEQDRSHVRWNKVYRRF